MDINGCSYKETQRDLDINNFNVNSQKGVFELMISLKLVLNKSDYSKLTRRISKLLQNYSDKFASVEFSAILYDMNFPENYRDFLN